MWTPHYELGAILLEPKEPSGGAFSTKSPDGGTVDDQARGVMPRMAWAVIAVFVVLAFARCWSNLPWVDEGWFFNPVYNWLIHGHTGTTVMEGKGFPWDGIERYQYWQPPLHLVEGAIWLKVFGLNLVAFRSLSMAAGVVLLISWMYLLRHFGVPSGVQAIAMVLIATDYALVRAGSDGRTDMVSASLGLASVAVYLRLRANHFTKAILASQTSPSRCLCRQRGHELVRWACATGRRVSSQFSTSQRSPRNDSFQGFTSRCGCELW